jgi:hypothetical protein
MSGEFLSDEWFVANILFPADLAAFEKQFEQQAFQIN